MPLTIVMVLSYPNVPLKFKLPVDLFEYLELTTSLNKLTAASLLRKMNKTGIPIKYKAHLKWGEVSSSLSTF